MGCDRAVHLVDDAVLARDELALARALADLIRAAEPGADLVVCGKQNIDNDAGEFGPALAECLDLPHAGAVTRLELAPDGRSFRAHRRVEGAEEVIDVDLPALVTAEKGLVEPRRPPLARLIKAKQQPIETRTAAAPVGPPGPRVVRFTPPPARPACVMIPGEAPAMARDLVRRLREEAKVL
jgi:electron transfer flavoprotein beta subunit